MVTGSLSKVVIVENGHRTAVYGRFSQLFLQKKRTLLGIGANFVEGNLLNIKIYQNIMRSIT